MYMGVAGQTHAIVLLCVARAPVLMQASLILAQGDHKRIAYTATGWSAALHAVLQAVGSCVALREGKEKADSSRCSE